MGEEHVPTNMVCAECMKMCCFGERNSVVKGLRWLTIHYICMVSQSSLMKGEV